MDYSFRCLTCDETNDPADRPPACPSCGGILEVDFALDTVASDSLPFNHGSDEPTMWRYHRLLPTTGIDPISLGEGWTPLVSATSLSRAGPTVLLKNETCNPTWSFKDRFAAIVLSHAAAAGETRITTSSTGNHGASTAAYACRAGMDECIVIVPHATELPLRAQIKAYAATVVATDDEDRSELVSTLVDRGWFSTYSLPDAFTGRPYVFEGYKTIAFEIVEQYGVPDAVILPVGAGDGFYGVWKGFRELAALDIIDDTPRMIAAEAEERSPLTNALAAGAGTVGYDDGPPPISVSTRGPTTGDHTLDAVRESGGSAFALSQGAVEQAIRIAGRDGVFVEPASALAIAAIAPAMDAGLLDNDDTVVPVATGAGIKWPELTSEILGEIPDIDPTVTALQKAVPFEIQ